MSCPPSFSVGCHSRSLLQTQEIPPSIKSLMSLLLTLGSIFGLVIGQVQSWQARRCSLTTCCEPDTVLSAGDSSAHVRLHFHTHGAFIQIKAGGNSKQRKENHYILCCCSNLIRIWFFATAAHQASLSPTISQSLLKLMSIASVMLSNHLILCCPLLLLPVYNVRML